MLRVFNKLHKYDNKYSLTIIGSGPDESKLREIAGNYGLPVKFLGNKTTKEIFNELSKHEIYIHTSVKESFSLSLLEAKIAGLRTIAYKYLEVPKEFIDYGVDDFKEYKWFKKIISIKINLLWLDFLLSSFDIKNQLLCVFLLIKYTLHLT